jgi:hypothetical protein
VKYSVEFGHIDIPRELNVPPYFGKKIPVSFISCITHLGLITNKKYLK